MSNIDQLKELLLVLPELIEPAREYKWKGPSSEQFYAFLQRAIIVRQSEAMQALGALVDADQGHFGVVLLRPAYEELVWLEYLITIPLEAPEISRLLGSIGVSKSVNNQAEYLGMPVMNDLGWNQQKISKFSRSQPELMEELRVIGKRLNWKKTPPTFWWLSDKVGRRDEYKFIYHATSSFVHFSPHELYRRVWGNYGNVSIKSSNFREYWQDFAAYWIINIFIQTSVQVGELLADDSETESNGQRILGIIEGLHPVPIITPSEVEAWDEPAHN